MLDDHSPPHDQSIQCGHFHQQAGMGSRQFCRGRGQGREVEAEARQGSNVVNQGRGRELEGEARQTKFEARPRRGDPLKNPPPLDV